MATKLVQYFATGKRKTSVARVILRPGDGKVLVNDRDYVEYFCNRDHLTFAVRRPLELIDSLTAFNVSVNVYGGGVSSQAGAIRHGISKAILEFKPEARAVLKAEGFLERDSREVERKKYGKKKARRSPQFSKR